MEPINLKLAVEIDIILHEVIAELGLPIPKKCNIYDNQERSQSRKAEITIEIFSDLIKIMESEGLIAFKCFEHEPSKIEAIYALPKGLAVNMAGGFTAFKNDLDLKEQLERSRFQKNLWATISSLILSGIAIYVSIYSIQKNNNEEELLKLKLKVESLENISKNLNSK
jgi:hypothetical protein